MKKKKKVNLKKKRKRERARRKNARHRARKEAKKLAKEREEREFYETHPGVKRPRRLSIQQRKKMRDRQFVSGSFLSDQDWEFLFEDVKPSPKTRQLTDRRRNNFVDDMHYYSTHESREVPFYPYTRSQIEYDLMSQEQLSYYLYWRKNAREGLYLKGDFAYYYLYLIELINKVGVDSIDSAYRELIRTLKAMTEEIELSGIGRVQVANLLFDFLYFNGLDLTLLPEAALSLIDPREKLLLIYDFLNKDEPLRLSFDLIDNTALYDISKQSSIHKEDETLLPELLPKLIYILDFISRKDTGEGLLERYCTQNYVSQIAFIPFKTIITDPEVYPKSLKAKTKLSYSRLEKFLDDVLKYTENTLRGVYRKHGRYRNLELDDWVKERIEGFIDSFKGDFSQADERQYLKDLYEKKTIELDFSSISTLRKESDKVQEMLTVEERKEEAVDYTKDLAIFLSNLFNSDKNYRNVFLELSENNWKMRLLESVDDADEVDMRREINDVSWRFLPYPVILQQDDTIFVNGIFTKNLESIYNNPERYPFLEEIKEESDVELSENFVRFLKSLNESQLKALRIIAKTVNPIALLQNLAFEIMSMRQVIIDEINEIALMTLDNIIIEVDEEETPAILEEYKPEVDYALELEEYQVE